MLASFTIFVNFATSDRTCASNCSGVVGVGSVVEVEDESGGRFEVEISSVVGGVSTDSPLGSALVGSKVGDAVRVQAPKGPWTARVIAVRSS